MMAVTLAQLTNNAKDCDAVTKALKAHAYHAIVGSTERADAIEALESWRRILERRPSPVTAQPVGKGE